MKLLIWIFVINSLLITVSCNNKSDSIAKGGGIVSLLPSLTETLCALEYEDSIVGRSNYCSYPPEKVSKIASMGDCINPNLEQIIRLKPSVVLLGSMQEDLSKKLKSFGIKSEIFKISDIKDIYSAIKRIGDIINRPKKADSLVLYISGKLDSISNLNTGKKKPVLFVVGRNSGTLSGVVTVNKKGFLSELLEISGGETIFPDLKLTWAKVSVEEIIRRNPHYIMEPSGMGNPQNAFKAWSELKTTYAAKHNNIHILNGDHFFIPGPRIVKTAEELSYILNEKDDKNK